MLKRLLTPNTLLLCTIIFYLVVYLAHAFSLHKTVYGDGVFYYSWIRSAVIDRDVLFKNEFSHFDVIEPVAINGTPMNKYAIGPAMLWTPAYLWIHTILQGTGYEFPYELVVGLTSVLYAAVGLILFYRLLATKVNLLLASISTICIAIASHLLFYGAVDPVNSHALSFFASVFFLTCLLQKQPLPAAFALGIITLIRPQDVIFGIMLLPYVTKKNIFVLGLIFFLTILPQLFVWNMLTGNPFLSPYLSGDEGYSLLTPHLISVLFSLENGLFLYTPLFAIACIGFLFPWNHWGEFKKPFIITLLLSWYLVASWSSWNQGASYSGRMFIGLLPIAGIALAQLFIYLSKRLFTPKILFFTFLIPLGSINILMIIYFLLTHG